MTDPRTALITGLMELAAFYAANPDVPRPMFPKFNHCVLADDDATGTAEVEAVAAALGTDVQYGEHVKAERQFAGVGFHVYYVTRERAADHQRRWNIARAATVDTSPVAADVPADLAALPRNPHGGLDLAALDAQVGFTPMTGAEARDDEDDES